MTRSYLPLVDGGYVVERENGVRLRYASDNVYIGPERPIFKHNLILRALRTAYHYAIFLTTQMFLFLILLPVTVLSLPFRWWESADSLFESLASWLGGCVVWIGTAFLLSPAMSIVTKSPTSDEMGVLAISGVERAHDTLQAMIESSNQNSLNLIRKLYGRKPLFIPSGCIIMIAPHTTNFDAFALMSIRWHTSYKIFFKSTLWKIPFFGWNLLLDRNISVPFEKGTAYDEFTLKTRFSDTKMNKQLDRIFRRGYNVAAFPEGGRTPYGRMMPFRYGMFKQAISRDIPIWVYAIGGGADVTPPGYIMINSNRMVIKGSPYLIFPQGHTLESLQEVVLQEVYRLSKEMDDTFDPDIADRQIASTEELRNIKWSISENNTAVNRKIADDHTDDSVSPCLVTA